MQWTGKNEKAIQEWMKPAGFHEVLPVHRWKQEHTAELWVAANSAWVYIETGEWILCDIKGFYPCKDNVFKESYDLAKPEYHQ